MVLRRFWEVFGGSEKVWNGFLRFEDDFAGFILRFYEDLKVREASGRALGGSLGTCVFRAFWWF